MKEITWYLVVMLHVATFLLVQYTSGKPQCRFNVLSNKKVPSIYHNTYLVTITLFY